MLVHVNTGMHLTATTQETVRLQQTLGSGAYFLVEPRYKLRSEGEKVFALDHVVLQSRRFAGAFLHSRKLSLDGSDGLAATEAASQVSPRTSAWGGNQPSEAAGGGSPDADGQPQGVGQEADREVDLLTRSSGQGWVVHRFASALSAETEDALRGGDYVRLCHREDEGYIYMIYVYMHIIHMYICIHMYVYGHHPTCSTLDAATHHLLLSDAATHQLLLSNCVATIRRP